MTHALLTPDPGHDHLDRLRSADLADAGLAGWCAGVVVTAGGEERFVLLAYDRGECDYWPEDWTLVAPHEVLWP